MANLFTNQQTYQILRYLSLPLSELPTLLTKIDDIVAIDEDLQVEILSILNKLIALEELLSNERNSINSGLIRADVLEWESGGRRSAGMTLEYSKAKNELAIFLGYPLPSIGGSSSCGSGSLSMNVIIQ